MEARIKLAKQALEEMSYEFLTLDLEMHDGDWEGCSTELELSPAQMCYLLKERTEFPEVFNGIEVEKVDIDAIARENSESQYCDDWVSERIDGAVPYELRDLNERLFDFWKKRVKYIDSHYVLEEGSESECEKLVEELNAIKGGKYTFDGQLVDENDFEADSKKVKLDIDAPTARSLAMDLFETSLNELKEFKGIECSEYVSEDDVTEIMQDQGPFFVNSINCNWTCYELDYKLEAWEGLIKRILDGQITEEQLEAYIMYLTEEEVEDCWEKDFDDIASDFQEEAEE